MRKLPFCVGAAVGETGAARFVYLFVRVFSVTEASSGVTNSCGSPKTEVPNQSKQ